MLIKQTRTIAYSCPICGTIHFETISLFDFSGKNGVVLNCKCRESQLKIRTNDYKKYSIFIPCSGCGYEHRYDLGSYDLWVRSINIFRCKQNGTEFCFIGSDCEVRMQIDSLEMKKDSIAKSAGFEKVFSNTLVMLEAFNKIHDIAEKDNVFCECGSKEIAIHMLYDRIIIRCAKCGSIEVIKAKNSFDLRGISKKEQIILNKQVQYMKNSNR